MQEKAQSYSSGRSCSGDCLSSLGVQVLRWDWLRCDDIANGDRCGLNHLCLFSEFVDSSESRISVAYVNIVA